MSNAIDNKPLNDQFFLGRGKRLAEIAAQGTAAQLAAIENIGLGGFVSLDDSTASTGTKYHRLITGAYWNGSDWIATENEVYVLQFQNRSMVPGDNSPHFQMLSYAATIGNPVVFSGGVVEWSFSDDEFNMQGKTILQNGGISFTGTGAKDTVKNLKVYNVAYAPADANFTADYAWVGRDVILDLTALTADRTITFDSADGWVDGDWVNFIMDTPNSSGFGITYTGAGTLTAENDESKLKQTNGAVSVKIDGTNARVFGKLKA